MTAPWVRGDGDRVRDGGRGPNPHATVVSDLITPTMLTLLICRFARFLFREGGQ
jgi:hypothetical protein